MQELDDMLGEYDLKETWWRSTIKHANGRTMQCGIRIYGAKTRLALRQLWAESEHAIAQKT